MKKHESKGYLYLFDVKCPKCKEWFRTESEMDEPPRHTYCRHCQQDLWDECIGGDSVEYEEYKYVGYLVIDLFSCEIIGKHFGEE